MFTKSFLLVAPAAVLLSGTSVFALTAEEVWADLQGLASENDSAISAATEVKEDGAVVLNGVSIGPAGKPAFVTIAEMSIEEQDDGSVAFFPSDIKVVGAPGMTASIEEQELSVSVFEDEGGLGYAVFADMLKVVFDSSEGSGDTAIRNAGSFVFEGLEASYGRATEAMTVDLTADRLVYDLTQVNKAAMIDSTSVSDSADLVIAGTLTVPEGVDLAALDAPGAFEAAVAAGLAMDATMTSGASGGTMDERSEMMPIKAEFQSTGSSMKLAFDQERLVTDLEATGITLNVTPPGMPMAFPASLDSLGMTYLMPIVAPEGGDYQLKLNLNNLVVGEEVWSMFDPGAALPREPANLALDLTGQAKFDMLAMIAADTAGTAAPIPEPVSLDIKELAVKVAGATLAGTGAFTFDNSMLAAGGPPMPVGTADLRLEGGNKLIDGLIAIGLLTSEDAMGARMMMAMFGKPEGEDVLTSQIEARQGGSIFVNGQQIQ
ncbi:DUF2125 domain-containing protein [Pseudotabrizicola sp. L79]|uniref:DUF2125 domain-containing protein n=1 Tax=Pseudotabrizicola sp. L79 TaxID=3118402 RepID=UPI002F934E24